MSRVLATRYRLPLAGMRNTSDGLALSVDGAQPETAWGLSVGQDFDYAKGGEPTTMPHASLPSGLFQFTMPANYITGSPFVVSAAVVDSAALTGAELVGKVVRMSIWNLTLDGWNGSSAVLLDGAEQTVTDGGYTEYAFTPDEPGLATLAAGDLISIIVAATWTEVTTPSVPVLVNVVVDLA